MGHKEYIAFMVFVVAAVGVALWRRAGPGERAILNGDDVDGNDKTDDDDNGGDNSSHNDSSDNNNNGHWNTIEFSLKSQWSQD